MKYNLRAIPMKAPRRAFKEQSGWEGCGFLGWEESKEGRKADDRGLAERDPVSALSTDHLYTSLTFWDLMTPCDPD